MFQSRFILPALAAVLLAASARPAAAQSDELRLARAARAKFLITPGDKAAEEVAAPPKADPKLPNVLLIGMSTSIGYTPAVRVQLEGKYNVYHVPDNARTTTYSLPRLDGW